MLFLSLFCMLDDIQGVLYVDDYHGQWSYCVST